MRNVTAAVFFVFSSLINHGNFSRKKFFFVTKILNHVNRIEKKMLLSEKKRLYLLIKKMLEMKFCSKKLKSAHHKLQKNYFSSTMLCQWLT